MFQLADSDNKSILDANDLAVLLAGMHRQTSVAKKGSPEMTRDGLGVILRH